MTTYSLLDTGHGKKLEQFGKTRLIRPCAQALWPPSLPREAWDEAHDEFIRSPKGQWRNQRQHQEPWEIEFQGIKFILEKTSFGHVGVFPEHTLLWPKLKPLIENGIEKDNNFSLLNLFGYSGAASLFAAQLGAKVCHLDASKGMVERARENAKLNRLEVAPIRWIVEDVFKFLKREKKRAHFYEGIILDPPSFGRGTKGEVFKIEEHLMDLLREVRALLSPKARFVCLTCHTPGMTPFMLRNILEHFFKQGKIEVGELCMPSKTQPLPGGIYALWSK